MDKFKGLIKAAHFGPTLLVTSISLIFSLFFNSFPKSLLIALTIFSGQLIVGWSNDLIDYNDDLRHQRIKKPLVKGLISRKLLIMALILDIPIAITLNLFGALGFKGGLISIGGVLVALTYNFYFKSNWLSLLPYAISFGALPCAIVFSANEVPKSWMWLTGGLFGIAAHFINVIKDLEKDRVSGINGLPQRIGKRKSIAVSIIFIFAGAITMLNALL